MAKKNNAVSTLKETQWNVLNITLVKILETLTDMTDIKETLTDMKETLSNIKDLLAVQAAGKDATASEPVQLTIDEVTEEKYYTPEELAAFGIRAQDADKFDIFDGDDIVLKDVSYRSYENGTRGSIWDMLGVAQSTFSHNYTSGKPFKMPEYGIKNGVVKMHRRGR